MQSPRRLAIAVGALLVVAAVLALAIVIVLGQQRFWFTRKVTFHIAFPDVAGLSEGAVVRLGGRSVGTVTKIAFSEDPRPEAALVVTVRMRADHADRVRGDSEAHITTQGLLGDKLLELTIGSPATPAIPDGGWVKGIPPADPARLMSLVTEATQDVRAALAALRRVVDRVDEEVVADAQRALRSIDDAAGGWRRAAAELQRIAQAVDHQAVHDASHDLADTAAGLSAIVDNVQAGRGSLGGLLIDPTLYEETKRLLVSLRRNRILTALARVVISREEPAVIMDASPHEVIVHPRPSPGRPARPDKPARAQDKPKRRY